MPSSVAPRPTRRLPAPSSLLGMPPAAAAAFAMNRLLDEEELSPLDDKRFVIRVTDVGVTMALRVRNGRLEASTAGGDALQEADVRISGTARNFMRLALRAEDPDTLFFHRDLSMEGDTEAGLYVKNLLDRLEPESAESLARLLGPRLQFLAYRLPLPRGLNALRRLMVTVVG